MRISHTTRARAVAVAGGISIALLNGQATASADPIDPDVSISAPVEAGHPEAARQPETAGQAEDPGDTAGIAPEASSTTAATEPPPSATTASIVTAPSATPEPDTSESAPTTTPAPTTLVPTTLVPTTAAPTDPTVEDTGTPSIGSTPPSSSGAADNAVAPVAPPASDAPAPATAGQPPTLSLTPTAFINAEPPAESHPNGDNTQTLGSSEESPAPQPPLARGLLGFLGLTNTAAPGGGGSASLPQLLSAAWWIQRIEGTLFNSAPTVAYQLDTSQPNNGPITGAVLATDPNNDPLLYSVTSGPQHGTVTLNPDGTFIYTPSAGTTAGSDSFTITVSDNTSPHIHGLAGLFNPKSHTATTTVAVTWDGQNQVPVLDTDFTPTLQPPNAQGVITGSVAGAVSDPDEDPISYSSTDPDTTVNPDGTFTYTPSATTRHDAAVPGAPATHTIIITASDGNGGTAAIPVTVNIVPANESPTASTPPTIGAPGTGGTVTGQIGVEDADGDTLTYTSTTPSKGAVTVHPDGTFTYTPTPEAQLAASIDGASSDKLQDSFTITVDDGHGGLETVQVSVPIASPYTASEISNAPGSYSNVVAGPNGTMYATSTTGNYAAGYQSTITVISPDGSRTQHTVAGVSEIDSSSPAFIFGPDGTAFIGIRAEKPSGGQQVSILELRPDGSYETHLVTGDRFYQQDFDGTPSYLHVGEDGTAYVFTKTGPSTYHVSSVAKDSTREEISFTQIMGAPSFTIGPDGTAYMTSIIVEPVSFTTVRTLGAGGAVYVLPGIDESGIVFNADGTGFQATYYSYIPGSGSAVLILPVVGEAEIIDLGESHNVVSLAPNGAAYLTSTSGDPATGYTTTVSNLSSGGVIVPVATVPGRSVGPVIFAADGTGYLPYTETNGAGEYRILIMPADQQQKYTVGIGGDVHGVASNIDLNSEGTLFFRTASNVYSVPPGAHSMQSYAVEGNYVNAYSGGIVSGPDGSTYYVSQVDEGNSVYTTHMLVVSADGTSSTRYSTPGQAGSVSFGPDGTPFLHAYSNSFGSTPNDSTALLMITPSGPVDLTIAGMSSPPSIGPDGTVYQTAMTKVGNVSTTRVVATSSTGTTDFTLPGGTPSAGGGVNTNVTLGPDGNAYLTTSTTYRLGYSNEDYNSDQTWVTIMRPDSTTTTIMFSGAALAPLQFGSDGNLYQTVTLGNATDGYTNTLHRIAGPAASGAPSAPPSPQSVNV